MKHQTVNVTEFKAKCLELLDGIGRNGGVITVTKRGSPLASIGPVRRKRWKSPEGALAGKIAIPDDMLDADICALWDVVRRRKGLAD